MTRKGNHIQDKERREEMSVLTIAELRLLRSLFFCLNLFSRITSFLFVLVIKMPK